MHCIAHSTREMNVSLTSQQNRSSPVKYRRQMRTKLYALGIWSWSLSQHGTENAVILVSGCGALSSKKTEIFSRS